MKLVKIRYITGPNPGFEHVMKEELARVLEKRGQVEIVDDETKPARRGRPRKAERAGESESVGDESTGGADEE